jgi:hypothetical protein
MSLAHLSNRALLDNAHRLLGSERELVAQLGAYLAEVESRRLHLEAGYSSMFDFCVRHLRMSEGEAYRRIVAARLGARFPIVLERLASGAVHLSALQLLSERLTDENHAELLDAASGKTKREVEHLLAARFPKPDVPASLRKRPERRVAVATSRHDDSSAQGRLDASHGRGSEPPPLVEPLSSSRYKLQLTISEALRDKLELARDLMSHQNPARDFEPVLDRALDLLLADLEKKKLAKVERTKRTPPGGKAASTGVPAAARRATFERDGLRCTYVSPDGRRCTSRTFLELDHVDPRARGGSNEAGNLRVRCRAHNQLWAEQSYGREHVERARHFRQEKSERGSADRAPPDDASERVTSERVTSERQGAQPPGLSPR